MKIRNACPLCHREQGDVWYKCAFNDEGMQTFLQSYYEGRVDTKILDGNFIILRCKACQFLWQKEILTDDGMEQLYEYWIDIKESQEKRKNSMLTLQYAKHCARLLRLFKNPHATHILDVGMGFGEWCSMAQAFGFNVHGVEISETRLTQAKKRGIQCSTPEHIPNKEWDFIELEQVLEHVENPQELIEKLVRSLKKGGYIHIGVPSATHAIHTPLSKDDVLRKGPFQPLEHINSFSYHALTSLLARYHCIPAHQYEYFIRIDSLKNILSDSLLVCARYLPLWLLPKHTNILFQKK